MSIEWREVDLALILPLRELYRREMNCQIVHDSLCQRPTATRYLAMSQGSIVAYAVVDRKYEKDGVIEFFVMPEHRRDAVEIFRELIKAGRANMVRAQTSDRLLTLMLYDFAARIKSDTIIFADHQTTHHHSPDCIFRQRTPADKIFKHRVEGPGDWVVEVAGRVIATGGALYHYNPPYGDVHMEVARQWQRKGYGSFLVQELKRMCYQTGKVPAARCNVASIASRKTLEKAGFLPCARILRGRL